LRPGSKTFAAIWGFAEATLFFIVPDVLISSLALNSLRKALWACASAALAASVGGLLVWLFAFNYPMATREVLFQIPGISEGSFRSVEHLLTKGLYEGMVQGAFSGVPYKIFAAEAGASKQNPALFTLLSIAARLPRFVLGAFITWSVSYLIGDKLSANNKLSLCLVLWAVFYFFYFRVVGW
jgi:membrane protein YqaA with SNARE-associated domain